MRKLLLFAGGFAAACALSVYLLRAETMLFAAAVAAVLLLLACLRKEARLKLLALGLSLGFLYTVGYEHIVYAQAEQLHETKQSMTVMATQYPQARGSGYTVSVQMQTPNGATREALLRYTKAAEIAPGDLISGLFQISDSRRIHGEENLYEPSQGQAYVLRCYETLLVQPSQPTYRFWHQELAQRLQARADAVFGAQSYFLRALMLGDKSELPAAMTGYFNRAGLSHVLVVSGMHISFLIALLQRVFRARKRGAVFTGVVLLAYLCLLGFTPSVVRAGVMWAMVLLAPLFGRERDALTSLGFALLLTLLQNPFAIASVSLQLSYSSALGILLFSAPLEAWAAKKYEAVKLAPLRKGLDVLASNFSISLSAQVFSLVLLAIHVRQISLLALLANLLAVWAASLAFSFGVLVLLLSVIYLPLAQLVAQIPIAFASWIVWVARSIGTLPFAAISLQQTEFALWFVLAYLCILLCLLARKRVKLRLPVPVCCLSLLLMLCFFLRSLQSDGQMRITVLDVGQGQSILVQSRGYQMLIDCGGTSATAAAQHAANTLWASGGGTLDLLVVTHYDADHAGGVPMLLEWLEVGAVAMPLRNEENAYRLAIEAAAAKQGTEIYYLDERDLRFELQTCSVMLYAPYSRMNSNDAGVCVLVSQGAYDMLVTGDVTQEMERRLLKYGDLPDIELLIAGHHGSRYATGEAILRETSPEYVAISCGSGNSYGHPHEETLARILDAGAQIYRTDLQGDLVFQN